MGSEETFRHKPDMGFPKWVGLRRGKRYSTGRATLLGWATWRDMGPCWGRLVDAFLYKMPEVGYFVICQPTEPVGLPAILALPRAEALEVFGQMEWFAAKPVTVRGAFPGVTIEEMIMAGANPPDIEEAFPGVTIEEMVAAGADPPGTDRASRDRVIMEMFTDGASSEAIEERFPGVTFKRLMISGFIGMGDGEEFYDLTIADPRERHLTWTVRELE